MREHTLIQAPYKQWRSGRVGWLYNNCLCGSHSCACVCFFSGEGEVRSLLMLVCWPTSVSFIPAATEGAEPKRKKKKIRLISLTPGKSNRHYPTSPKARKYQLPSLPHRAHSCPSQNMASQHLQACQQMWPNQGRQQSGTTEGPLVSQNITSETWNASSQAVRDIMWPFSTENDQDLSIYTPGGHGHYLISCSVIFQEGSWWHLSNVTLRQNHSDTALLYAQTDYW